MQARINNPWVVCLIAASSFFYLFIQITMFNVLKPHLILAFNIDSALLSIISALYFCGNVFLLIPAGLLLDTISARKLLLIAMAGTLVGVYIFSSATSVFAMGIGRLLIGITGGTTIFTGCMRLATRWFDEKRLASVSGIIVSMGMLGGMTAQLPFGMLIESVGWQKALHYNFILGLIIFAAMYWFVFDYPRGKENEYWQQISNNRRRKVWENLKTVVTRAQNWYCGIFASLLNLPIMVFGALWGFMYLRELGFSHSESSFTCTMLFCGLMFGGPFFGFVSDKILRRKPPMYIGNVICGVAMSIIFLVPNLSFLTITGLFFVIGFTSGAQVLAYPVITESNSFALSASALSFAGVILMAGGAIAQPVVGWLIERGWDGKIDPASKLPVYNIPDYNFGFWLMPICLVIAMAAIWFIRETYCKRL